LVFDECVELSFETEEDDDDDDDDDDDSGEELAVVSFSLASAFV